MIIQETSEDLTAQLLVFAAESILLLAGLVKLVADTLELSLLVAKVALRLLVQGHGLLEARLDLDIHALQLFRPLLQLPSCSVGLLQVDDEHFHLFVMVFRSCC